MGWQWRHSVQSYRRHVGGTVAYQSWTRVTFSTAPDPQMDQTGRLKMLECEMRYGQNARVEISGIHEHRSQAGRFDYYTIQTRVVRTLCVNSWTAQLLKFLHTWMFIRQVAVLEHCSETVGDQFALAYTTGILQFSILAAFRALIVAPAFSTTAFSTLACSAPRTSPVSKLSCMELYTGRIHGPKITLT